MDKDYVCFIMFVFLLFDGGQWVFNKYCLNDKLSEILYSYVGVLVVFRSCFELIVDGGVALIIVI